MEPIRSARTSEASRVTDIVESPLPLGEADGRRDLGVATDPGWQPGRTPGFSRREQPWRDALLRRMLALADVTTALVVSLSLAAFPGGTVVDALWSAFFVPIWILLAKMCGLYDRDQRSIRHLTADEVPALLVWTGSAIAAMSLFLWATPAGAPPITVAVRSWLIAVAAAIALRAFARFLWRRIVPRERALIVGSGALADATRRKLELFSDIHVDVVAQEDELEFPPSDGRSAVLEVDRVMLATQSLDEAVLAELVAFCRAEKIKLSVVPPARGMFGTAVRLNHVADLPVVEYNTWDVPRSTLFLKRTLDFTVSLLALVVLAPLFALIAVAIKVESRGPVIFTQCRAGQDARPFRMRKFRTMVADAEERLQELVPFESLRDPMFKLADDPRVTRVGRLLRRTSLDELPQLWNVLRGDMSLVGPRPEQIDLVERYRPEHRFRLTVKPGLTGPMQVYGRGRLTFEERLAVERDYIENLSLRRDLHILALTVSAVWAGRGAY